jgi:NAD(P)-dependent dehydrogenase (short-subunit alcohol dehydrogenase family)/acyl dehydratase
MNKASFSVDLSEKSALEFAEFSGDWNPLHTDAQYAANSKYQRPILHGAYSAGLISRLAGMELPGQECLLHGMRLRFVAPIYLPGSLLVQGQITDENRDIGRVSATVSDAQSGRVYVEAQYEFSRLRPQTVEETSSSKKIPPNFVEGSSKPLVLVTGASGGIGGALTELLGERAIGLSRRPTPENVLLPDLEQIGDVIGEQKFSSIVHCAWPAPDNYAFSKLNDPHSAIEHNVAAPLRQIQALASALISSGADDATLVLIGSTAAQPGRHNYRMPLYSLSKSLIPTMTRILAMELAAYGKRCIGVEFDIVDGGMSASMNRVAAVAHQDRSPAGIIPDTKEVAEQINWILGNTSSLISGAMITLSGGTIP